MSLRQHPYHQNPYRRHPYHLVIGLGKSGLSMARFLAARGERVIVTDIDSSKTKAARDIEQLGIETQIGFHDPVVFDNAACLIPSPGIPLTIPCIAQAIEKGVPVMGELDIFQKENTLPVIAVTGTNGKTTTTTLLGKMLTACGYHVFVGGNIGTPLVDLFMSDNSYDMVVAEISSFQMDISRNFKPDVGILLNISEDHLDRYDGFQAYENAKWRLFENQTRDDVAVINQSIAQADSRSGLLASNILKFSSAKNPDASCQAIVDENAIHLRTPGITCDIPTEKLHGLPGVHNHENAAAALLAGLAVNADIECLKTGLNAFKNLSHRIEYVDTINGIRFYDDSKATNIDAVIRAIQAFGKNIILILGGREKGTDFHPLVAPVKAAVKAIVALGENKEKIKQLFDAVCPTKITATMKEAVRAAFNLAGNNGVVLLSPACASFDMYDNYEQRGQDFTNQVQALKQEMG